VDLGETPESLVESHKLHAQITSPMGQWRAALEPVHEMCKTDPLEVAQYAWDHRLMNKHGWKWAKKYKHTVKHFIKVLHRVMAVHQRPTTPKYKFGVHVPEDVPHAYTLDKQDSATHWHDAMAKELQELDEFNTFEPLPPGSKPPEGFK
jgi:hypothetical protein